MNTLRRPLILSVAIAAALAVVAFVVTFVVVAAGPKQYEARVAVVATPKGTTDAAIQSFGSVVALTLPGVTDLVKSPTATDTVIHSVDGAPSDLADRISVGIVPASGLARISVTADSPELATKLVLALQQQALDADLLAPAGKLTSLGQPTVTQVAPDFTLGAGFGLAAAVAAGLIGFGAARLLLPDGDRRIRSALRSAGTTRPVAVLHSTETDIVGRLRVVQSAAGAPLELLAVEPDVDVEALAARLSAAAVPVSAGEGARAVVAVSRPGAGREVALATGALPDDAPLVAVVVSDNAPVASASARSTVSRNNTTGGVSGVTASAVAAAAGVPVAIESDGDDSRTTSTGSTESTSSSTSASTSAATDDPAAEKN
ncbi:hypothetical protein P0W64_13965 [Tsukamurella sp. 8F]|uniref:hypothetical protein n=1 Tax=unclassified Tsukamurella TaxID=2633480 RepID=UPI0023B8B937|nr:MULTISPECIES: hypothetical protein [unclassified Tsukamurella]MDF0530679.1 hypothetical protein [Tsukamurella sp. 8J]MDF0587880.1 hypothetical protein [Tsukamurella sp. 8F]